LALGAFARGYAFEAEVLLLAAATAMPIVEVDIDVLYPPASERVTHFHVVKDPARIVGTVVRTALRLAWRKRGFRWVMAVTALVCGLACLRAWVRVESAPPVPPLDTFRDVAELQPRLTVEGDTRRAGEAFVRSSDGILQVFLDGAPERRGAQHGLLLGPAMEANERALWKNFSELVPWAPARFLLTEWGRFRYRSLHRNIPPAYLREIAAQVVAAQTGGTGPSPRNEDFPDYERALFLHGLYDIALSFEHSPLIGCTVLALGPEATASGHPLVARAFDFEAGEIFDREKAVFFVREEGRVPYASVAWPGLVGVLTGMNAAGVYLSVNGARAGTPRSEGLPVVFGLREALARATTTGEAVEILLRQEVMVSHLVFVADASGTFAVVERVPGQPGHVRTTFDDPQRVVLTNHFEGPFAEDPRNRTVKETTSTLGRRKRGEELVQQTLDNKATPTTLLSMLRDHKCAQSRPCALGDRNTIDAFIATHGVLADTANQVLWVSVYPHLSGRFVPFALKDIFASYPHPSGAPAPPTPPGLPVLPEDTETPRRPAP
jgi:hypothetical protein